MGDTSLVGVGIYVAQNFSGALPSGTPLRPSCCLGAPPSEQDALQGREIPSVWCVPHAVVAAGRPWRAGTAAWACVSVGWREGGGAAGKST